MPENQPVKFVVLTYVGAGVGVCVCVRVCYRMHEDGCSCQPASGGLRVLYVES